MEQKVRLNRLIAQCGVTSRRKADTLIEQGRVTVNGTIVSDLGYRVDQSRDVVAIDGRRIRQQPHVYFLMHKPDATICSTADPEGRPTVFDLLKNVPQRIYSVGRLDFHTTGVLLLTNDGVLADQLMHPRNAIPRRYHVKIKGAVEERELTPLREGLKLDDGVFVCAEIERLAKTEKHTWIEMTLFQGVNRQIHRMLQSINRQVLKLIRTEFAGFRVDDLKAGTFRALRKREIERLKKVTTIDRAED